MRTRQSRASRLLIKALQDAAKLSQAVHQEGFIFEGNDYEVASNLVLTRIAVLRELTRAGELERAE